MVAEIMALLIFIGVGILLFVRYQGGVKKKKLDSKELQISIESLQKEMDKASTEAIERMGSHVNRFEKLMKEAKTSDEDLSHRLKEIRALEDRLRKEIAESRALSEELKIERDRAKDLRDELQRQAALTSQIMNNNPSQIERTMITAASKRAINSYEKSSLVPDTLDTASEDFQTKNENDFAAILSESIEREEERERQSFEPLGETYEPSEEAIELLEKENFEETKPKTPSDIAKKMLTDGASIEDVMRKSGMGRGAVELLAQMMKKR